jgi:hypothetical protein
MHQQLGVRRTRANGTEARALALRCQRTSQSPRIRKSCGVRRSIPLAAGSLKEPRSSKRKKVLQIVHLFFEWTRSSSLPGTRSSIVRTNRKLSTSLVDKHIGAYQIEKCYFEFSDVRAGFYSPWTHPLLIPSYAVLASIVILLLQTIFLSGPIKALRARFSGTTEDAFTTGESSASGTRTGLVSAVKDHVERSGGLVIFAFQLSRLVLVLALLVLSIFSFLQDEGSHSTDSGLNALNKHWGKWRKRKHRNGGGRGGDSFSEREWLDLAACLTYVCPTSISFSHRLIAWNSYLLPSWLSFPSRHGRPTPRWRHSTSLRYCLSHSRFMYIAIYGHCLLSHCYRLIDGRVLSSGPKLASLLSRVSSFPWSHRVGMSHSIPRPVRPPFRFVSCALTPSAGPSDSHKSRADGILFVFDAVYIPRSHSLQGISCSTLVARYVASARRL